MFWLRIIVVSVLTLLAMLPAAGQGSGRPDNTQEARLSMVDVDLGEVELGVDTETDIVIVNVDDEERELKMVYLADDVDGTFRLKQPFYPVVLPVGASTTVTIIVNLAAPGTYATRLIASTDDDIGSDDTASCMISAHSTTLPDPRPRLRFALGSVSATVGHHVGIPLICLEGGGWLRTHQLSNVACYLRYRRSILTCDFPDDDATVDSTMRTVRVSLAPYMSADTANGDTIMVIPMTACLGDVQVSDVEVTQIVLDLDTEDVEPDTMLTSTVTINDAWPGDGPRSVRRDSTAPAVQAYPNPSDGRVTLSLHAWQQNSEVRIHALDGSEVFAFFSNGAEEIMDLHLEVEGALAPGAYVCTYRSNDSIAHSSFIVLR